MRWTPHMPERVARQGCAAGFAAARPAIRRPVVVAYDKELAGRIRQLIGSDPELTGKKIFGGLAFLICGNMAIAASSEGGTMVRVDPLRYRFRSPREQLPADSADAMAQDSGHF